jgi:hypothetical protein
MGLRLMSNREEYCPFPDKECNGCSFYWLDGCVLANGKTILDKKDEEKINGMEE